MEKPVTASLNRLLGMRLYSPVATGTAGLGLKTSLLPSDTMPQIRKDVPTDVSPSQGRGADGQVPCTAE